LVQDAEAPDSFQGVPQPPVRARDDVLVLALMALSCCLARPFVFARPSTVDISGSTPYRGEGTSRKIVR